MNCGGYVNGNYISIYIFEENYHHQTGRVSPHLSHEDSFCIIAQICFYFREGKFWTVLWGSQFQFQGPSVIHTYMRLYGFCWRFCFKKTSCFTYSFFSRIGLFYIEYVEVKSYKVLLFAQNWHDKYGLGCPLPRMPVTARIIIFLVRDPYEPSFATERGPSKICFINFYPCHCWETDIKITHDPTMTLSFQPIPPALFYPTCIDNCLCQFFGVPACQQGSWSVVDPRKFNMDGTNWCFEKI